MLLKLAYKNIWRHSRRSMLAMLLIAFGVVSIVTSNALLNDASNVWARQEIKSTTGAFQLSHRDYQDRHTIDPTGVTLDNSAELIRTIESVSGVVSVSGQLDITGVVSSGSKSSTFDGKAIDVEGHDQTLPDSENMIVDGAALGVEELSIVLGEYLAKNLDLVVGDTVIVAVRTFRGGLDLMYGTLVGIKNGNHFPASTYLEMHLPQAQKLLKMDDRVSHMLVRVDDIDEIPEAMELTREQLMAGQIPLRIESYVDLIDMYSTVISAFKMISYLVGFVLYIVVGGGIASSMYMAVRERRKEIGTLLAIGMRSADIKRLFVLEGGAIGASGAILGVLISIALATLLAISGGLTFAHEGSDLTISPVIDWVNVVLAMAMALIVGILAAWFPAAQAAGLEPVVCLSDA